MYAVCVRYGWLLSMYVYQCIMHVMTVTCTCNYVVVLSGCASFSFDDLIDLGIRFVLLKFIEWVVCFAFRCSDGLRGFLCNLLALPLQPLHYVQHLMERKCNYDQLLWSSDWHDTVYAERSSSQSLNLQRVLFLTANWTHLTASYGVKCGQWIMCLDAFTMYHIYPLILMYLSINVSTCSHY